jgi:hypothetical protein
VFASLPRRPAEQLPGEVVRVEHPPPFTATDHGALDVAGLRGLGHHGCVSVRGLVPPERAEALARGIDRAHVVEGLVGGPHGIVRPEFGAGDALLFDHLFLHRTGVGPGMTQQRWAIESWFFGRPATRVG